ncbi:Xanthine dehydrogenase [Orchesella cincta]|uniref:Xanthine dehydrogenase n=1 Tax=Orchesella cincta TaxID=48709 RepID=A0A1D2N8U0_ORCCI|nr:Xanthine dehydrogenase [Orchesella cincta]
MKCRENGKIAISCKREEVDLTGTKVACGVGGCGSCTVLISRYCSEEKCVRHTTVNACLTPLYTLHGAHILTVEGLSDCKSYHQIQEAIALENATQCGYCSPGFVMSMFGMQAEENNSKSEPKPCSSNLKTALQGNLCRCTGYRPMLEAFYKRSLCNSKCQAAKDGCCGSNDIEDAGRPTGKQAVYCIENKRIIKRNGNDKEMLKRIEEIIMRESSECNKPLTKFVTSARSSWVVPTSMEELSKVINGCESFKIVAGGTSDEFWKSLVESPQTIVDVSKVKEMRCVVLTDSYLRLGASLTIDEMQKELKLAVGKLPESKTKVLKALLKMIEVYASGQIRKSATIGGSLKVTSSASDFQTANLGLGLTNNFATFNGSDKANSIVESIDIPITEKVKHAWFEKVRRRKDFDLALVNMAVKVTSLNQDTNEVTITVGGTLLQRFTITEEKRDAIQDLLKDASDFTTQVKNQAIIQICLDQLKLNPTVKSFVESTIMNLLKKFGMHLNEGPRDIEKKIDVMKSTRLLTKSEPGQPDHDLVHRQVPHASAIKHATGEAKYCDDIPKFKNELELIFVLSSKPHANILSVDFSEALKVSGVVGTVTHEDVLEGNNKFGLVEKDEEIFASTKVTCYGQIIAGILANKKKLPDAIKYNSFYSAYDIKLVKGDCETVFDEGHNVLSGEVKVGSQEHFYMETQGCIVIPKGEDHEMEIVSSTQNPTGIQMEVANVLNVPAHRIVVKVKRVGGGFGGKESRCIMIALPAAIAAQKFGRPVRCVLSRETDMIISGKRATYLTQHKVAFDNDGRVLALQMSVYITAGNSIDVSMAEIERVIINLENAYNIPNLDLKGYVCKTNAASNTVFRGTGAPQAAFLMENIVDMISTYLRKEPSQVRSIQIYQDSDFTPYGQSLKDSTVLRCWNECLNSSNYQAKKKEVDEFNRNNCYNKRGISINPINFGIGYTALHLNQGAALVNIYTDGTVLISHSGVEIGQGVHTKMIQIATRVLGIPGEKIRILETATDKVPNSTPSSASMTSDLNGGAVMQNNPAASWEELVTKAYMDRVSLSATGFYKVPEMGWDPETRKGNPWSYFSSGAACSVVELDCLTGQFQILSTDIVMDVGNSLNPSIDVGQIEGAFMQGVGLFLLEELVYDENGRLCTAGPVTYKIPTVNDTPLEFNVSFLTGSGNPKAIYSSKTVGEPPLLLATSVFFAVKDAIRAYRETNRKDRNFRLDSPATVEKILLACHTILDD